MITRMPVMLSRTTRTMRSMAVCKTRYMGMPFREIYTTPTARMGKVLTSTKANLGSIIKVTTTPPKSSMGARTPSRCIMPSMRWIL